MSKLFYHYENLNNITLEETVEHEAVETFYEGRVLKSRPTAVSSPREVQYHLDMLVELREGEAFNFQLREFPYRVDVGERVRIYTDRKHRSGDTTPIALEILAEDNSPKFQICMGSFYRFED